MTKKVMSVTIDQGVYSKWKSYVNEECINASKLIEKLLREHLEKRRTINGKK